MANFEKTIEEYLNKEVENSADLAAAMLKPEKNLKACCSHIMSEAKKLAENASSVAVEDSVVYGMAVNYYLSETPAKVEPAKTVTETTVKTIEKAKAENTSGMLSLFEL